MYRPDRVHLIVMDRVTVQEAARRLGISQDAVRQRIRRGSMRHDKDDKGRVYVYLDPTDTHLTDVHDVSQDAVHDPSRNELITELRDRVRFLEAELTDRKEESRRKDHIIAALTQRIPQLEPASEPREHSENPTEHLDRGTTSTNESRESRRPLWVSSLGNLALVPRLLRKRIRRVERSEVNEQRE
jgi:excisionase family DNA binding protein